MNRSLIGRSYMQVATTTASPGQLVLMLYDGAIRFLEGALRGFHMEDPAESNAAINDNVQRAQAILDELNAALNMGAGGELAEKLRGLYSYLDRRLFESNLRKETEGIQEVILRLSTLRDAWREMLNGAATDGEPERVGLVAVG
ncbi:MAG: flagellar export chaperone FliS [Verrucomicrobiales bacterium]|nr:flagellar export chaperone FliS [Verrucomicrobiales bacterium]